jgi:hypothetical protein
MIYGIPVKPPLTMAYPISRIPKKQKDTLKGIKIWPSIWD